MEKNVQALADRMVDAVKTHVAAAVAGIVARLEEFDARLKAIPVARDGKDADPELMRAEIAKAVAQLPAPKEGKDADPETIRSMVDEAVAAIPKPKDGTSVTTDDVRPLVVEAVASAVSALPKPKDGESVPIEQVQLMVEDAVTKVASAIRIPEDGEDGRDAAELDILPSIDESKGYRRGTWASHNGGLIRAARQTDPVQDGALLDAGWVVMVEGLACPPVFTQGEDPRELTVAAMLTSGVKAITTFRMPAMAYKEVWREGEYEQGDVVTWAGSAWHCQQKTMEQPGNSSAWRLMVKKGAPGKDADAPPPARDPVVRVK